MIRRVHILGISLIAALLVPLLAPSGASAQYTGPYDEVCKSFSDTDPNRPVACKNKDLTKNDTRDDNPLTGPDGVLMKAVNIIAWIIGIASVIIIIISGLKYMTANGDPKSIEAAKNTLLYAVIGLVIFLMAQAILVFVVRQL